MRKYYHDLDYRLIGLFLLLLVIQSFGTILLAQKLPIPQAVREDQMVSFPQTAHFEQVVQILSIMSTKFNNRVIIDPTGQKGPINIEIPPCHWLKAFEMLLSAYQLEYVDKGTYLEIIKPTETGQAAETVSLPAVAGPSPTGEPEITKNSREIEISAIFFQGDKRMLAEVGVDWNVIADKANIEISTLAGTLVSQQFLEVAGKYADRQGRLTITGLFNTFEALNIGEVIARPSVMVLDGAKGTIQVGASYSIKQKDFAGNTVEKFFDVGTILDVTPQVIHDGNITFIHLNIRAEKSSATPDPISTKIDKQMAATDVLLLNGEQTAIAGLYSEEKSTIRKGIPKLKDLPWWVLGIRYLAGYNATDIIKKELIIILRAELVPTLEERLRVERENLKETIDRQRSKYPEQNLQR